MSPKLQESWIAHEQNCKYPRRCCPPISVLVNFVGAVQEHMKGYYRLSFACYTCRPFHDYCRKAILTSIRRLCIFAVWYALREYNPQKLQSEEEDNELVKDEGATKHEIVQDNIKRKFQMNGSGWASQVFFSTWRNWEM